MIAVSVLGCSKESSGGAAGAATGAASATNSSAAKVAAAFKAANIQFTQKDKTPAAKELIAPSRAGDLVALTEYKFEGNSIILLVAEAKDEASSLALGDAIKPLVEKVKSVDASYEASSVGGLNDKKSAVYIIKKENEYKPSVQILSQISK